MSQILNSPIWLWTLNTSFWAKIWKQIHKVAMSTISTVRYTCVRTSTQAWKYRIQLASQGPKTLHYTVVLIDTKVLSKGQDLPIISCLLVWDYVKIDRNFVESMKLVIFGTSYISLNLKWSIWWFKSNLPEQQQQDRRPVGVSSTLPSSNN